MNSKIISTFYSDDKTRKADVVEVNYEKYYAVDFYENDKHSHSIAYTDHSIHYAEDAAENYVLGVNKECQSNPLFCQTYSKTKNMEEK